MTNPLIAKYEEIYGKKEEPKPEYVKPSQEQTDILNTYLGNTNFPYAPPQSVATSNTGITAANPYPKVGCYDTYVAFLDAGEKIKRGEAHIVSVVERDMFARTEITFVVRTT